MRYWLTSRIKSDGKGTGKSRHGSLLGWLRREDSRGHDASDKRSYNAKDTPQGSRKGLSQDHANKPVNRLGLHIIHDPKDRKVDIIFVHGLGGTSHGTWTKHKDPNLFWPGAFLPLENDISQARISTFGYQADIFKPNKSSILDFAKQLLYDMKFAKDNNGMELGIGEVCSMVDHYETGFLSANKTPRNQSSLLHIPWEG
jgi:hypothetical protein